MHAGDVIQGIYAGRVHEVHRSDTDYMLLFILLDSSEDSFCSV